MFWIWFYNSILYACCLLNGGANCQFSSWFENRFCGFRPVSPLAPQCSPFSPSPARSYSQTCCLAQLVTSQFYSLWSRKWALDRSVECHGSSPAVCSSSCPRGTRCLGPALLCCPGPSRQLGDRRISRTPPERVPYWGLGGRFRWNCRDDCRRTRNAPPPLCELPGEWPCPWCWDRGPAKRKRQRPR